MVKINQDKLQQFINWVEAESCDISNYLIPKDLDRLANQESLSILSYTNPLPLSIGSLTKLRSLSLRNNKVLHNNQEDKLPSSIVNLLNLEELSLDYSNELKGLENLLHLKNLKTLSISFYEVDSLPKELEELTCEIKLHLNSKGKLPDNLLQIKNLTELSIYDDYLEEFPMNLDGLKEMTVLKLNCKSLRHLPQALGSTSKLNKFELASECIKVLPGSITSLTALNELELYCENLIELPESIGDLSNLKKLILVSQYLCELPKSISNLKSLKELRVDCHNLENLPESIGKVKSLEYLTIRSNNINNIPQSINDLENLIELVLEGSSIKYLPKSLESLDKLNSLIIRCSDLIRLPEGIENLSGLSRLEVPQHLYQHLPEQLLNKSKQAHLKLLGMPRAKLYKPDFVETQCAIGCIMVADDWSAQSLLDLKEKCSATYLVGLLTSEPELNRAVYDIEDLSILDGIIRCQEEEVIEVVELLNSNSSNGIISLDPFDVMSLLDNNNILQYVNIRSVEVKSTREKALRELIEKFLNWLSKHDSLDGILIDFNAQNVLIEELAYICDTVEPEINVNDNRLLYQTTDSSDPNYMGLRVLCR